MSNDKALAALKEIAEQDDVEMILDPTWAKRIAQHAVAELESIPAADHSSILASLPPGDWLVHVTDDHNGSVERAPTVELVGPGIDHGICEGCGAKLEPKEIEVYGSGWCHVVAVADSHGDPTPEPCGPVHRFVDADQLPIVERVSRKATGMLTADDRQPIYEGDTISIHQFNPEGGDVRPEVAGVVEYSADVGCYGIRVTVPRKRDDIEVGEWVPIVSFYGLHEESFTVTNRAPQPPTPDSQAVEGVLLDIKDQASAVTVKRMARINEIVNQALARLGVGRE